jgi:hypothetical protein
MATIIRSPMELLVRAYADMGRRTRAELQLSPGGSEQRFSVAVLGVMRSQRLLMVAAPRTRDNSLIAVTKGNGVTCQWMNATTAWRFHAVIANLAFEPAPILYLGQVSHVRRRTLRAVPRALAALAGAVRTPALHAALVTDLSASGARVALGGDPALQAGQQVELALRPRMFGRDFVLDLPATVASCAGNADPEHPLISFFGLQFGELDEQAQLVLHAYVQERLAQESDLLSQLLAAEATAD